MEFSKESAFEQCFNNEVYKCVLSNPADKNHLYKKIVISHREKGYFIEKFTEKQVFQENQSYDEVKQTLLSLFGNPYKQYHAWDHAYEYNVRLASSGKLMFSRKKVSETPPKKTVQHNRDKNYILKQGTVIQPLVDMGIFTQEGKVVQRMYDKYRQINRFIEIINDEVEKLSKPGKLTILDIGCGKSYLSFIVYYYFRYIMDIDIEMIGLDKNPEVIEKCSEAARKFGYDGLSFHVGDIESFTFYKPVDIMLSLHACNTATDYALFNAVQSRVKMIFSVPCCHHELNEQMQSEDLSILTRYGIVKERIAALMTDAVRGNLLRCCGYKTTIMEFIDFDNTPKNIMIKAVRDNIPHVPAFLTEVESLMSSFQVKPTLYHLLKTNGYL